MSAVSAAAVEREHDALALEAADLVLQRVLDGVSPLAAGVSDSPSSSSASPIMAPASQRMTARSIRCSSSRTFPGQSSREQSSASGAKPPTGAPAGDRSRKCAARSGMSSRRSRSGGRRIGKTLSR